MCSCVLQLMIHCNLVGLWPRASFESQRLVPLPATLQPASIMCSFKSRCIDCVHLHAYQIVCSRKGEVDVLLTSSTAFTKLSSNTGQGIKPLEQPATDMVLCCLSDPPLPPSLTPPSPQTTAAAGDAAGDAAAADGGDSVEEGVLSPNTMQLRSIINPNLQGAAAPAYRPSAGRLLNNPHSNINKPQRYSSDDGGF